MCFSFTLFAKIEISLKFFGFCVSLSVDGKLLVNGSIGYGFPMKSTVAVPTNLTSLYIKLEKAEGGSEIVTANISGTSLTYTFTGTKKQTKDAVALESGPDCNSGCDVEISGNTDVTIKNGQTYCVKTTFTGNILFEAQNGGGTLRVCGTANIGNINNPNNDSIASIRSIFIGMSEGRKGIGTGS